MMHYNFVSNSNRFVTTKLILLLVLLVLSNNNNVVCGSFAIVRLQPSSLLLSTTTIKNNDRMLPLYKSNHYKKAISQTRTESCLQLYKKQQRQQQQYDNLSSIRGGGSSSSEKGTTQTKTTNTNKDINTNTQLLLSSTFNTGTKCPMTGTATILGSLWGTGGVIYILYKAIKRVIPIAIEPFQATSIPLTQFQLL
jgi:hypothetical protein